MSLSSKIRSANPIPERGNPAELSPRAERELASLLSDRAVDRQLRTAVGVRRSRRRTVLLVAVAVALVGVPAAVFLSAQRQDALPPTGARERYFSDSASLEAKADIIVRATVADTRERTGGSFPETIATVKVIAVAKGGAGKAEDLQFSYTTPGAAAESPQSLKEGSEYVFFLEQHKEGVPTLLSALQGYYAVVNGSPVAMEGNTVTLSPSIKQKLALD